jgi:altronate dehydratase small subunit
MNSAFVINARDNVATVLAECPAGQPVALRGETQLQAITPVEAVRPEHKVALVDIPVGGAILKYGISIGHAVKPIAAGAWVHLHNCASNYDERSNTLDGETGAPTDTKYE